MNIENIIEELTINTDTLIIYNKTTNNYIFEKTNNNKKIKTKEFLQNKKIIKKNLNNKITKEYKKEIIHFFNILHNKLGHCNFDNLNNNINTLTIKNKKRQYFNKHILAMYTANNELIIDKNNYKESISHELLHMASAININSEHSICGFEYMNLKKLIKFGTFINEGYTELLNLKYFTFTNCYELNINFAILIEIIIGKKLMEKMYFNADITGFINELMRYNNSAKDVINFIMNTDKIHYNAYKMSIINRIKLKKALIEVNKFLIHTYQEKLKILSKNNEKIEIPYDFFIEILKSIRIDINFNAKYIEDENNKIKKLIKN